MLEFWCGRRRTSMRKHPQTVPDVYGVSFDSKTNDLITENTYFYYGNGEIQVLDPEFGRTVTSDGGYIGWSRLDLEEEFVDFRTLHRE